jgi:hypothetical protein
VLCGTATGGAAPRFWASAPSGLARRRFAHNEFDLATATDDNPTTNTTGTANTANMRTYEDTFSGQKIYPGKVRLAIPQDPPHVPPTSRRAPDTHRLAEGHCYRAIGDRR